MNFDYSQFDKLPQKELENISLYINKVIEKREHSIIDAVAHRNVEKLKEALSYDNEKKLPKQAWNLLNFYQLEEKDIDFFFYIRKLPTYPQNDTKAYDLTITQSAVNCSLHNIKIFDRFIVEPELKHAFKAVVAKKALERDIKPIIINKLFEYKLLEPNKKLIKEVIDRQLPNYLKYLLDNHLIEISKDEFKKIYLNSWNRPDKDLLSLIKTTCPEFKDISLNALITKGETNDYMVKLNHQSFVKSDDSVFLETIMTHGIKKNEIKPLIAAFNTVAPDENKKFHKFVEILVTDFPEVAKNLKGYQSFIKPALKSDYQKAVNYIELNLSLDEKPHSQPQKMKI